MKNWILIPLLVISVAMLTPQPQALAQIPEESMAPQVGPRKQLATIIFAGLAGAVLGLSTLSFYGRPQDKLQNIAYGFGIGIIIGAAYTTYRAATRPYEAFGYDFEYDEDMLLGKSERWTQMNSSPAVGYAHTWDF